MRDVQWLFVGLCRTLTAVAVRAPLRVAAKRLAATRSALAVPRRLEYSER